MDFKNQLHTIFEKLLNSADPANLIQEHLNWQADSHQLTIKGFETLQFQAGQKIFAIGSGKAAATMAKGLEQVLGNRLESGMIIVPPNTSQTPNHIQTLPGNHPIPGNDSLNSTKKLLRFIESLPDNSVVFHLLSGGTSALLCSPSGRLSPEDIQTVFLLLIESGATIQEVNTVRKVLSSVKGGQLLNFLRNQFLIDLIISDVPDDDRRFIGSGPTTSQEISFLHADKILNEYTLWEKLPLSVQKHMENGIEKENSDCEAFYTHDIERHESHILMSARKMAGIAADLLENEGFQTQLDETPWEGSIEKFETHIQKKITSALSDKLQPVALVFFGECTVQVSGDGLGGRNQELALRMAKWLSQLDQKITFMSTGTDGIDGPTDAAGAIVDQKSWFKAKENSIDPDKYLQNNDSYHFFDQAGGHIKTGPSGNNLMDIQIVLIP